MGEGGKKFAKMAFPQSRKEDPEERPGVETAVSSSTVVPFFEVSVCADLLMQAATGPDANLSGPEQESFWRLLKKTHPFPPRLGLPMRKALRTKRR